MPSYLKQVDAIYVTDAYHSLSIEGYRVSTELIERVRAGGWNPASIKADRDQLNAMAARGYWQAFQLVKQSVEKVLTGQNPGAVAAKDHSAWYRELFGPSVTAGIVKPAGLAGYRSGPVYIRRSMHVPPNHEAVRVLVPTFFGLLAQEQEPAVRVVLGHFMFVYIHPCYEGNGRMGRFLMNMMFASGTNVDNRKTSSAISLIEVSIYRFSFTRGDGATTTSAMNMSTVRSTRRAQRVPPGSLAIC